MYKTHTYDEPQKKLQGYSELENSEVYNANYEDPIYENISEKVKKAKEKEPEEKAQSFGFIGMEKDDEMDVVTGNQLSYGVRFYDPKQGKQHGVNIGEYYNKNGKKIGEDGGGNGGGHFVVSDNKEAKAIKKQWNNGKGSIINALNVKSSIKLPSSNVRKAIGVALKDSNSPSTLDAYGGKHEEGLVWGDLNGQEKIIRSKSGGAPNDKDGVGTKVPLKILTAKNPSEQIDILNMIKNKTIEGTAHIHPSGTIGKSGSPNGENIFVQEMSDVDIKFQQKLEIKGCINGPSYVIGANESTSEGGQKVYIYTGNGKQATFPLLTFLNLK